jgi:hypothetical protein
MLRNVPLEEDGSNAASMIGSASLTSRQLINTPAKVRNERRPTQKDVKNEGRSGDVYENKESRDKMTELESDIMSDFAEISQKTWICGGI